MTPAIAFFNNKGGVGKTTLVYHLAWMFADLGRRVLVVDLDPQANLTASFLSDEALEELFEPPKGSEAPNRTIYQCLQPLIDGEGDVRDAAVMNAGQNLWLLPGDLALAQFEDALATAWLQIGSSQLREFRVATALSRVIRPATRSVEADLVLVDLAPSLGALNRSALLAADYVITPLTADLYSLQGLKNVGAAFTRWRTEWAARRESNLRGAQEKGLLDVPGDGMRPLGYVLHQHSERQDRPVRAYARWIERIPREYALHIRQAPQEAAGQKVNFQSDPDCLGLVKNYRSLVPMAMEARRPIFHLRAADGALGAHYAAAQAAAQNFEDVARRIEDAIRMQEAPLLN